ncbi:MAG: DUF3574 domain-containing protein [Deltaproteobacteria bacterium]|nr:MAG: DUF3574 domain-containing protein [Deltaproteobacteria bacterium]
MPGLATTNQARFRRTLVNPRQPIRTPLVCLVLVVSGFACASSAPRAAADVQSVLFFGLSRTSAPDVSDDEFQAFVEREIATRFPDGFTVLQGIGHWRGRDGIVHREPSRVLVLVRHDSESTDRLLREIVTSYCSTFAQESVLRVDVAASTSLK